MVQEIQAEKKLVAILFMNIKETFNYVLKKQLIKQIIELRVDRDLIKWTKSFFTKQTI